MRPQLRKGDYDGAVERAVVDIGLALAGHTPEEEGGGALDWFSVLFFSGIAFFVGRTCWRAGRRRREARDCKRILTKVRLGSPSLPLGQWNSMHPS